MGGQVMREVTRIITECQKAKVDKTNIVEFVIPIELSNDVRNALYDQLNEYGLLCGFKFGDFPITVDNQVYYRMSKTFEKEGKIFKKYILKFK
jgi:hypothetical protein